MISALAGSIRRNHALEHATISVLLRRIGHDIRMVGRATRDGYYLYANVPTELVESSTREALARMKAGEGDLAVSPLCGTNLVVSGALAGVASMLALGNARGADRLPNAILASMLAVLVAQPAGRMVQRYITTSPDLADTEVVAVKAGQRGGTRFHKVQTMRRAPA